MARVLIVDDDPDILHLLTKILSVQGHTVFRAQDAIQAMDHLNNSVFDLLISDANMPKFSGFELIRTVKNNKKFQRMAVAMLTGLREKKDIEQGIRAGVDDYIIKPIDPVVLLDKLDELFRKKPPRIPSLYKLDKSSAHSKAKLCLDCRIESFDEFSINIVSAEPVEVDTTISLDTPLFERMKVNTPKLKIVSCKRLDEEYVIHASFIGLREPEVKRIREWIQIHQQKSGSAA